MFRFPGECIRRAKTISSAIISDESTRKDRIEKVLDVVRELATEFNLPSLPWLEKSIRGFKRCAHTRFIADNFLEALPFNYLEIEVLEGQLKVLRACGA